MNDESKTIHCIRCKKEIPEGTIIPDCYGAVNDDPDVVFCAECELLNYMEFMRDGGLE